MFWEHDDWSILDADETADALETIRAGLPAHERDAFAMYDAPDDSHAFDDGHLQVRSIRVRRLGFYPDHWLYELGVSPEAAGFADRYESARAFVVLAPVDAAGAPPTEAGAPPPPHRRPALVGQADALVAVLLDWSSGVIHQLNQRAGLRLAPDGRVDRQLSLEYLDFFVSFIGGGADSREPFLLLRGGTLEEPTGIPRKQKLTPFEQAIREHSRGGARVWRCSRPNFIPENASSTDDPDFVWEPPGSDQATVPTDLAVPAATKPASAAESGSATVLDPARKIPPIQVGEQRSESGRVILPFEAFVLYENVIFEARFELSCEPDGTTAVSMLDDKPVDSADSALLRYQADQFDARGIRLLLLLKPRTEVTAGQFLEKLGRAAKANALSPASWVENLRVSDDVNLQLLAAQGPLRMRNVEFMGRVVLDECRRGASVVLEQCHIARSVEARNCVIDGDLVMRNTTVLGATAKGAPLAAAVCLERLRITGSLDAQQMEVLGEFAAPNADIGGRAVLCGMHQMRRCVADVEELEGITMPNATVKAGIDLSPHEAFGAMAQRFSRTRIEGSVALAGLNAPQVDMRGTACGAVDLSWARVDGLLDLGTVDPSPSPYAIGNRHMRVIVESGIDLRGGQAREIRIGGVWIKDGDLSMIDAKINGSLFARPSFPPAYRTRIGGSVNLSSAQIRGDTDFGGASIDRALMMRTGSFGRLFMEMYPSIMAREDEVRLDWFHAEVGSIEIVGISGLGTIGLAGVRVGEGVLIEHVESRGDVRFYSSHHRLQPAFDEWKNAADKHIKDHAPDCQLNASSTTCSASVRGDVEMRCLVTGGHIDLTNMKVDGGVRLNDARIGTDLFARRSWLRGPAFVQARDGCAPSSGQGSDYCTLALECSVVDLDNARVGGDALLSGMNLCGAGDGEGRFLGRGLQVGGKLEFHAGVGCMAQIEGGIDLAGARAAELRLPHTKALCASAPKGSRKPAETCFARWRRKHADAHGPVTLERGSFGKLSIERPIPKLDLRGIDVAHWELGVRRAQSPNAARARVDSVGDVIDILQNMSEFDRSVWISYESKIRNEARASDADRVYRTMKNREGPSRPPTPTIPKCFTPKSFRRLLAGETTVLEIALQCVALLVLPFALLAWARAWLSMVIRTVLRFLFYRTLYGYGTRVWPAIGIWMLLSLALFAMLRQPDNVKVSDNALLQLGGQCRTVQERAADGSSAADGGGAGAGAVKGAVAGPASALPAKCAAYFAAIDATAAPSIEITAAKLNAAGAQSGYDLGDAALLSLRYAIPFIGAFGEPDWVPVEQAPARIGTARTVPVDVGVAPSILAAVVLLANAVLLSFAAAFVAKRWLR